MHFEIDGLSTQAMRSALAVLFEEGLIRMSYVCVENNAEPFVVHATGRYAKKYFGDMQARMRELFGLLGEEIFFLDKESDGTRILWMSGQLVESVTPSFLYKSTIVNDALERNEDSIRYQIELLEEALD